MTKHEKEVTEYQKETRTVTLIECDLCGQTVRENEAQEFGTLGRVDKVVIRKESIDSQHSQVLDELSAGQDRVIHPSEGEGYKYRIVARDTDIVDENFESIDLCRYCLDNLLPNRGGD